MDSQLGKQGRATRDRVERLGYRLSKWKPSEGWIIWDIKTGEMLEEYSRLSSVNGWCDIVERV